MNTGQACRLVLTITAAYFAASPLTAQRTSPGEWPVHHRDYAGTHYSPLAQIDRTNVDRLEQIWSWAPDTAVTPPELRNISTPLMVGGTLYFTTGANRDVVALDAATGALRWRWSLAEGELRRSRAPRRNSGRGVSLWRSGSDHRVFVVTPGFRLVALDANTGKQVSSFGREGVVDLKLQLGVPLDPDSAAIGSSSPPLVWGNVVVVGPALEIGLQPRSRRNIPGRIMAFDARTGALAWRFNTIPQRGEEGAATWSDSSASYTGNAGAWAPMSLDERRGWVYVPVEAATGDYYGGHRKGNNLFSSSLVCLDVRTGRRIWHYQIIHHDIWDYDIPTAPILADVMINGRRREIVAQITKQAFVYVLDRVTGRPIWPIAERPVPPSDVPGEVASATQPLPTRPAPFDRQGVDTTDLVDFTAELRARALEAIRTLRLGPLFTPPSLAAAPDGSRGTLSLPGNLGGGNWEHGAMDPVTGVLYVGSTTSATRIALANMPARSDMDYIFTGGDAPQVNGLPLIRPPWSRITAINLNSGDHIWMRPNGETPPSVASHPALAGLDIPPTGGFTRPVLLLTSTLLFNGDGSGGSATLRARDKATGEEIWKTTLPGAVTAQPMTYMLDGRQYIAIWTGSPRAKPATQLIVMALPPGAS